MIIGENRLQIISLDVDIELIDKIIITFKSLNEKIVKSYPDDIAFNDGNLLVPITQEDTIALSQQQSCEVHRELQINFKDKSVKKIKLENTLLIATLNTEIVEGNTPSEDNTEISVNELGDIIIVGNPNTEDNPLEAFYLKENDDTYKCYVVDGELKIEKV